MMGSNKYGKLGIGSTYHQVQSVKSPMLISELAAIKLKDISFNHNHSVALGEKG